MTKECHPVSRQIAGQSTGYLKPGLLRNNARRVAIVRSLTSGRNGRTERRSGKFTFLRDLASLLHVIGSPSAKDSLRLSYVISVLPVVGNACVPENELHEIGKARFCTHIIGENDDAALTLFQTNYRVSGLLVVSTFEEAMPLRPIEDHHAQSGIEIFALLVDGE